MRSELAHIGPIDRAWKGLKKILVDPVEAGGAECMPCLVVAQARPTNLLFVAIEALQLLDELQATRKIDMTGFDWNCRLRWYESFFERTSKDRETTPYPVRSLACRSSSSVQHSRTGLHESHLRFNDRQRH